MNSRKNFICKGIEKWIKKENSEFDITMGNNDGAEACELVGLFLLSKIASIIEKDDAGMYRDDGLAVIPRNGPIASKIEKQLHKLFKKYNLSIQVESNITTTDFLDVIMDLDTGTTKPYRKENDTPMYINVESNHPPATTKQLPKMIASRLTRLSTSQNEFNDAKPIYEKALKDAGYDEELKFMGHSESKNEKKRSRKRNITWYTPPYNKEVRTNITKEFLKIVDRCFTSENPLRKIFNKNTLKISYSTTKSINNIISAHNKKILRQSEMDTNQCNCRGGVKNCPIDGRCQEVGTIYQAEISAPEEDDKVYIGAAATTFKLRWSNHKKSFNHRKYEYDTEISKYIWQMADKGKECNIKWKIIRRAKPYSPTTERCDLCITEKTIIANYKDKHKLLNTRNELLAKCRHREKWLLCNIKNQLKLSGRNKHQAKDNGKNVDKDAAKRKNSKSKKNLPKCGSASK